MKVEPDQSPVEKYKLIRKAQESASSAEKLQELVSQVKAPVKRKGTSSVVLRVVRSFCLCWRKSAIKVYDYNPPTAAVLIPPKSEEKQGKKTLVLDLDETLVHSTFDPSDRFDFVVKVNVEGNWYNVYVNKRPGLESFLQKAAEIYELIVYTASLANYADPVLDHIDSTGLIQHRLFREHCVNYNGSYVKDLSRLGRDLASVVIIDVKTHIELTYFVSLSP